MGGEMAMWQRLCDDKTARVLAVAWLATCFAARAAAQSSVAFDFPQSSTHPQFSSRIDLVALNVVVTDAGDRFISGLASGDFAVYEDGVQQDISFFADAGTPLDLAILLDTSVSMRERMPLVRNAAAGFARTLRPSDRGMIIAFNDRVEVMESFTHDLDSLVRAIERAEARGGTALYNAIYVTLKELARLNRQNAEPRRQAVVVLSDGQDTASGLNLDEALDVAKRANTSIYTIAMSANDLPSFARSRYHSSALYAMKAFAQQTGARPFQANETKDLPVLYGAIAQELGHQYALGYVSKNPRMDGMFRRVVVRVLTPTGARPRTRPGYIAPTHSRSAFDRGEP